MRNFLALMMVLLMTIGVVSINSCDGVKPRPTYPRYSVLKIDGVPDSLKFEHKEYIIEMVTAGNQSGTNLEDVDDTLREAKRLADEMFITSIVGLRKEFSEHSYDDMKILPKDFNEMEVRIFQELIEDSNKRISLSRFKARRNSENEKT